jgi:hypothetical protein
LPGGANAKRPNLVIEADELSFTEWSDKFDDLFFEVDVTNRGETSIAKDWKLCLPQGRKALYFDAQDVGNLEFQPDIAKSTFVTSIEHGHVVKGWLRFHVPRRAVVAAKFNGSVQCRDYLEHESLFAFAPSKDPVTKATKPQ